MGGGEREARKVVRLGAPDVVRVQHEPAADVGDSFEEFFLY